MKEALKIELHYSTGDIKLSKKKFISLVELDNSFVNLVGHNSEMMYAELKQEVKRAKNNQKKKENTLEK